MKHAERAKQIRDEYEALTSVRPVYPRSSAALQRLSETLEHAKEVKECLIAGRAEVIEREIARLGRMDENILWTSTRVHELEWDYPNYDVPSTMRLFALLDPVVVGKNAN